MTTIEDLRGRDATADPPDPASIMLPAVALIGLGVTMIYSASFDLAGTPVNWQQFWKDASLRQLVFVPPALLAMWLASHIPHTFWRIRRYWICSPSLWMLVAAIALLAAVLVLPARLTTSHGAQRWIKFGGGFSLQPSELAKVASVLVLAGLLADVRYPARKFLTGLLPLVLLVCVTVLPIVKEDFGTGFLVFTVAGCLLMAGGTKIWQLLLFIPPAAVGAAFFILTSQYRMDRIRQYLHGGADPQGADYHINQSLMAIASGHWYGRGLGEGIQKFQYLPEGTTDFIFANLCEELGLIGGFIVIGVFLMLLWQLRRAMAAATDALGQLIVLGVMLTIGFQAAMNIAVVSHAVPTKGISLPFVSSGGSGLVIMSAALGLAASVARGAKRRSGQ